MSLLSHRARNAAPSPTLAITARFKAMRAAGEDVIGFGAGEPDFDTPEHIKQAAREALDSGDTKYTASSGTPALKAAICAKLKRDQGLDYEPKQIIASCGAKHSIYNLMQAILDRGDEVIISAPYWVSYPEQAKLAGGVPVVVEAPEHTGFRLSADAVASAITERTKLLVLNSPSNPSGAVIGREQLQAIAELAVEHDFLVLSDEIYEKLVYGEEHVSIASLGSEIKARTLVVNGFSKAYAMTGWRLGYLAGDADIVGGMSRIQDQSTSNPTSFVQAGGVAALNGDQSCVEEMRQAFEERRNLIVERLNAIPGITCTTPGGAFYVLPNVSGLLAGAITDSDALAAHLLDTVKIAVVPGSGFGMPQHLRMSYAASMEDLQTGLDRLEQTAREIVG